MFERCVCLKIRVLLGCGIKYDNVKETTKIGNCCLGIVIVVYRQGALVPTTPDFCFPSVTEDCPSPCRSWPWWPLSQWLVGYKLLGLDFFFFSFHFLYYDELPSSCFVNRVFHFDMLIVLIKCFIFWPDTRMAEEVSLLLPEELPMQDRKFF